MHITSQQIHTRAAARLESLRKRAAMYRAQALARPGDSRNMTLARMIHSLADEAAAIVSVNADLLAMCGDVEAGNALHKTWQTITTELLQAGRDAIDAALPGKSPAESSIERARGVAA